MSSLPELKNKIKRSKKVIVLGIGNELRGDDAAGILFVKKLKKNKRYRCYDCGTAPENFIGRVEKEMPDLVLLVDAADFEGEPGSVLITDPKSAVGMVSTHSVPLSIMTKILEESGIECVLVGIKPKSTEFGGEMSAVVKKKVEEVVDVLSGV